MIVCTIPIRTCTKNDICLIGNVERQMSNLVYGAALQSPSSSCSYYNFIKLSHSHYTSFGPSKAKKISPVNGFQEFQNNYVGFDRAKDKTTCISLTFTSMVTPRFSRKTRINFSTGCHDMNLRFLGPKQTLTSKVKFNAGHVSWRQRFVSAGVFVGLLVCFSKSGHSYAEAPEGNEKEDDTDDSSACSSHGKKVLTKYSVIGIPGDGRCLFRSVAHGACIRSGKPAPNENLQRELADELRARVADEFVERREETEWFIEGNFETYVSQMRRPHVWGGEPELLMASHVLQMPITVYMHDQESGGLISIAEYGQEYGKNNPIKVLYHGFGHYDALRITHEVGARPRL